MIRLSEVVLPGHPNKFCDQIADAIVAECVATNRDAYAQIEVSAWADRIALTGGISTRRPLARSLVAIVREVAHDLYRPGNFIDPDRFEVLSNVCIEVGDCLRYTRHVNDQAVVIGWAGYDAHTRFLPPEHFLAHALGAALFESTRNGPLTGEGPDGKLLVRLREEGARWQLEHVLVTLQQRETTTCMALIAGITDTLAAAYSKLQQPDPRWVADFDDVTLLINPNGPLVEAGPHGDNGQTGRKLVVDFYGPRVPIGGGALCGKHLSHIDRIGAYAARQAAIRAVTTGAQTCLVRLAWAPNLSMPLDVSYEMEGRGERLPAEWFEHGAMCERVDVGEITTALGRGWHFWDPRLPWNLNGCVIH